MSKLSNQQLAMIGSVVSTWISLIGMVILAIQFDHEIAPAVVNAFIAIVLGSATSTAAIHIFSGRGGTQSVAIATQAASSVAQAAAPAIAAALTASTGAPQDTAGGLADPKAAAGPQQG